MLWNEIADLYPDVLLGMPLEVADKVRIVHAEYEKHLIKVRKETAHGN